MAAILFVIPINVPAWTGERSIWFNNIPQLVPAFDETASTKKKITRFLPLFPTRHRKISDKAGTNWPRTRKHLLNSTYFKFSLPSFDMTFKIIKYYQRLSGFDYYGSFNISLWKYLFIIIIINIIILLLLFWEKLN